MTTNNTADKTFAFRFIETDLSVQLELTNISKQTVKSIDILTIFLKNENASGGPSQVHIRFKTIESIQALQHFILPHTTWIDGKPVGNDRDQLSRLKGIIGEPNPYVLDISWQDKEEKMRFQRIPLGQVSLALP